MPLSGIVLTVVFRQSGWRWPLAGGDVVQVWKGADLVAEFPGEFVVEVLRYHLTGVALQQRVTACVTPAAPKPMLPRGETDSPRLRIPGRKGGRP